METTENTENKTQNKNVEVGALWKKQAKSDGQTYLSGHVEVDELGQKKRMKVVVFSNKNKTKDNAPDYRVYLSRAAEYAQQSQEGSTSSTDSSEELM
tara:strand:+ start:926 stop:1216 length:291 start_codon:yes stop_codon:yes gene_type:complete